MVKQTGSFVAEDGRGRRHTVYEYTAFDEASSFEHPEQIQTSKHLQLGTGETVHYVQKGVYQVVSTGLILKTRDAP